MSPARVDTPLRVPELGPALGRVVSGTGRTNPAIPLDGVRLRLVSRLFDAAGEARRLADANDPAGALAALDAPVWLGAWEGVTAEVADAIVERVNAALRAEAFAVRMPTRTQARMVLDAAEIRGVSGRLGASGAPLVRATDQLAECAGRPPAAGDDEAREQWRDALLTTAGRMEAAWLALEQTVDAELARWSAVIAEVARWRRPWWPLVAVGLPALAAAAWLGAILGGYLASPAWLTTVWSWLAR